MTQRFAYSIPEFCKLHGFSRSNYYNIPPSQRPRVMHVNGRVLITSESAADWRAAMVDKTETEQKATAEAMAAEACGDGATDHTEPDLPEDADEEAA